MVADQGTFLMRAFFIGLIFLLSNLWVKLIFSEPACVLVVNVLAEKWADADQNHTQLCI